MNASVFKDPALAVKDYRKRVHNQLENATVPQFGAATSDILSQELQEAVDKLLAGLEQRIARTKKRETW